MTRMMVHPIRSSNSFTVFFYISLGIMSLCISVTEPDYVVMKIDNPCLWTSLSRSVSVRGLSQAPSAPGQRKVCERWCEGTTAPEQMLF